MIIDRLNSMCWATALNTGGAGTYLIGDQIDLGAVPSNPGNAGTGLWLVLQVTNAMLSATGNVSFVLASDAQAAITTDGTETRHYTTRAFVQAELTAGTIIAVIPLPTEPPNYERYLGILQITDTAAFTAGAVSAFLVDDPAVWKAYANAVQ